MLAGAGVLPLAWCAACPGFLGSGTGFGVAAGAVGGADRVGAGQAAAAGGPQAASQRLQPFLLAVPAFGQVEDEVAAAVPGGAGGDGDQVAADRGGAGLRERGG